MGSIAKSAKSAVSIHLVDGETLLWNQEAAILDTTELICELMEEAGISRAELARRMGTSKGNITQILDGSRNLTLRTVSDLMSHLGHEFKASCKARFQQTIRPSTVVRMVVGVVEIEYPGGFLPSPISQQDFVDKMTFVTQRAQCPIGA